MTDNNADEINDNNHDPAKNGIFGIVAVSLVSVLIIQVILTCFHKEQHLRHVLFATIWDVTTLHGILYWGILLVAVIYYFCIKRLTNKSNEVSASIFKRFVTRLFVILPLIYFVFVSAWLLFLTSLCLRVEADSAAAFTELKVLIRANDSFFQHKCGQQFNDKYSGYCKQTSDLLEAAINDNEEAIKMPCLSKKICAKEGFNGESDAYLFRYTVIDKPAQKNSKEKQINSYMLCAWPKEIGHSAYRYYITREDGAIYARWADPGITMPLTKWPSEYELKNEWVLYNK